MEFHIIMVGPGIIGNETTYLKAEVCVVSNHWKAELGPFSAVSRWQRSLALQLSVMWGCECILEEDEEGDGGWCAVSQAVELLPFQKNY